MERLVKNPQVVCTDLEEGGVLLNMESRFYYSLNRTGMDVWNLLDATERVEAMVAHLLASHDGDGEAVGAGVTAFLERLGEEGLTIRDTTPESPVDSPVASTKSPYVAPELLKHDEPLHEVPVHPFDPQLPLAE